MSRKNRKRRQRNVPQSERARRQLEKGDAKAALKEAKVCFRAESSDENRRLLEEAFVARVEQLHRMKQISQAKVVLAELVKLDPVTPQVAQRIPRLQVIVGDNNADADAIFESDPSLFIEMVDQAVLDPRSVVPDHGDIKPQVIAVREALAAVERGDDQQAAELLTVISRNSPLADWRLLVRGLSAFYQHDEERTKSNWQRLDAARPASRIARTLLTAARMAEAEPDGELSNGLRKLERHIASNPALDMVKQLSDAWKEGQWRQFFKQYRQFRQRYAKSHETLIRQFVDVAWKRAVREANRHVIGQLSRIGPAPAVDPRWNRAKGLLAENPDSGQSADAVEAAWVAYAQDVSRLSCLREQERPIAEGLVYQRLGREFAQYAKRMDEPGPFGFYDEDEQDELRETAARYYRRSIEACPRLQASYLELAELHEEYDEANKAARVMEKLARQEPDCFEAAIWLAFYYLSQDEPGKSERHVETAKRLRPRDPQCATLAWNQKVAMIRRLTIKRQFEAARHELREAVEIAAPDLEPYTLDLLRAGIEFKAKNLEAANQHVETALAKVDEPTPIWMQMSSVAARMRVAREFKKTFDERFKTDIKKPPTSGSAGRMARLLLSIKVAKANYTGRATQEKLLIQYLRRALDIEWNEGDLRHVCQFLTQLPRQRRLLLDFIDVGSESFPQIPHFHLWAGLQEIESGPFFCDFDETKELFEKAIQLHEQGDVKLNKAEIETARSTLSMVKDYQEQSQAFSESASFGFDDDDDFDFDDDYDDEEDFDDDVGFGMPPIGFGPIDDDFEEGFASTGIDEATLARLESTMPPEIKRKLEEAAAMTGMDTTEALRMMIGSVAMSGLDDGDSGPPKPKATKKKKQTGKRKKSRR